jgi:3(or 17)beta-hydroxysteroid dehydrogenase
MVKLAGKTALITGAASGIGLATASLFAAEGAHVIPTDLTFTGDRHLDVTQEADWERVIGALDRLDILVANAGISFARPVTEMTLDEWRRVMSINLDGVFLGVKHAVRAMRRGTGGSIVIVSSASGIKASPGASAYCASKAALRLFAKSVALECINAGDNIRVNTVHPAGVVTPMWQNMPFWNDLVEKHGGEEGAWRSLGAYAEGSPLKRMATPLEIARAILYLASDDSSLTTGSELVIDGGYTA